MRTGKIKRAWRAPLTALCLALVLAGFFAADLTFFHYAQDTGDYTLTVETGETATDALLWFEESFDTIRLKTAGALTGAGASVFALTEDGAAAVEAGPLSSGETGSYLAAAEPVLADADGDGAWELTYYSAKTDLQSTQGFGTEPTVFSSDAAPLEIVLTGRTTAVLYYRGSPLARAAVVVTSARSGSQTLTTGDDGALEGLSVKDLRSGFSVTWSPDGETVYVAAYQLEKNALFTLRWLYSMLPFLLICALSALIVLTVLFLRRRIRSRRGGPEGLPDRDAASRSGPLAAGGQKSAFGTVRWIVLLTAFVLIVYGGRLLGVWFAELSLPIFSCPMNMDQLTGGSCYYLAHLEELFALPWTDVLLFFATFALSLLLLGRVICGFLCPLGLAQDAADALRGRLRLEGVTFREKHYAALGPVKWTFVALMLGLSFAGGSFCDLCPALTLSPAFNGFQVSLAAGGFLMIAVLVGGFFKRRLFCSVCPMGFFLGLAHKLCLFRLKKDAQACTECGACYAACPMGVKAIYTERERPDVTSDMCVFCGRCVQQCPEDNALAITFAGRRIYTASREKFLSGCGAGKGDSHGE